jgi:cytochrome P450
MNIDAEIKRRHLAAESESESDNEPRLQDTLDWYEQLSKSSGRPVNVSNGQIALSMAAIHTTSNLLTNVMYDLAAYPEYIQPLRDEILAVIAEDGCLKKSSLLKLKLMDSVMKETQRVHPVSMGESNSNLGT